MTLVMGPFVIEVDAVDGAHCWSVELDQRQRYFSEILLLRTHAGRSPTREQAEHDARACAEQILGMLSSMVSEPAGRGEPALVSIGQGDYRRDLHADECAPGLRGNTAANVASVMGGGPWWRLIRRRHRA